MRDIRQQVCADFVGDFAIGSPVSREGIRREAADYQPGLVFQRQLAHALVVDALGLRVNAVGNDIVEASAAVGAAAMRQMPAHNQVHAHDRVADIQQGGVDGVVGGSAGQRLHIDEELVGAESIGGEELGSAPPRQRLDHVGEFRAFVIA